MEEFSAKMHVSKILLILSFLLNPCASNGRNFNWAANAGRYTKWPDQGTLVIARPGLDDDGIFQCLAQNQFGTAQSNIINVRRAELGDFKPSEPRILPVKNGDSVILECNVPLGYPPPVVTWQIRKESRIQYIKETNRRATDINGFLYISAVIPEDDQVIYTCVANNDVLRHQKNGPSYIIRVIGQLMNYPMRTLYRTPRTEVAVVGDKLQLKCIFSGYPVPEYKWFKDGKTFDLPNVMVENLGTMLEINPVSLEVAGNYRCQGTNEATQKTVDVQYIVKVRVRPEFIDKPEDVTVPVNGSVVFKCSATGLPAPKIRWTVNGLDPSTYLDGTRKVLEGNVMHLRNLTVKDTAVIQCNASNTFGYAFTNAFVNVMREPPFFLKPPQSEVRVVDGNEVTIYCETLSAPKALIAWTKDGRPINGGRYHILESGSLFITAAAITDSGLYECVATNPFGSRKAYGRLKVRRRTSIVLAPINTRVYEGQVVKFLCTADTDPAEQANLAISWYKDGNLIEPEVTPRIQPCWFDYSLILSGAQPRDTGQYRCNASNGLDFATASASLLVQGRPEQPINVRVNCVDFISNEIALVSWYPGSDNYAPIIEYLVEYSTQYERDTWYPAELYNQTGLVQSASVKVLLRPAIDYQFRVRTRNRVGVSLPSEPSKEFCGISSHVPVQNPSKLYVYGTRRNNLIIQWTPMPYIEHYGSNLAYILTVACLNCTAIPRDAVNTTVVGDWRTDRVTYTSFRVNRNVYEIETYKQFETILCLDRGNNNNSIDIYFPLMNVINANLILYLIPRDGHIMFSYSYTTTGSIHLTPTFPPSLTKVSIQSRNEKGISVAQPTISKGFSGEAIPTLEPPLPTLVNSTSHGAILEWPAINQSDLPSVNGFFRGYRIEWCGAELDADQCTAGVRFQDVILRISETPIFPSSRSRRSINVLPSNLCGDDKRECTTSQTALLRSLGHSTSPVCRPDNKHLNVSCPSAGLYPRAAQSPAIFGDVYPTVFVQRQRRQTPITVGPLAEEIKADLNSSSLAGEIQFQWGQNLTVELRGAAGNTTIKVWLRVLNNQYAGPMGPTQTLSTREGIPGPVQDLKVVSVSVNYADLTWTPPTEPNGQILGYEFEAKTVSGLNLGLGFRYPTLYNASARSIRMPRLKPNTTYRLSVMALTSAGPGLDTFVDVRTEPSNVAPNPPMFVITRVGRTNFTILYEPSHRYPAGTVFFAQYRQPGIVRWLDSDYAFINRTIEVTELWQDTTYVVRMIATNGATLSSASGDRYIRTLGGPRPGGLTGHSGTWFIIVCVLLVFFFVILGVLIAYRRPRLEAIRRKFASPPYEEEVSRPLLFPDLDKRYTSDQMRYQPASVLAPSMIPEEEEDELVSDRYADSHRAYDSQDQLIESPAPSSPHDTETYAESRLASEEDDDQSAAHSYANHRYPLARQRGSARGNNNAMSDDATII